MQNFNSPRLRASGNLSYLDFLRLLEKLWLEAHPGIPLQAAFTNAEGQYPLITYRLDLRKPHQAEPKPRLREEIRTPDGEDAILIFGQRFQSVITFTVMSQVDPHTSETILEVFEDFMIEFQPIFKELGASELVYVRRLPDSADSRPGEGVVSRSVSYLLTTEKIIKTSVGKFDKILIDARLFLESEAVMFTANTSDATITVMGASFGIGDRVKITGRTRLTSLLPPELPAGYYIISNLVLTSTTRHYELSRIDYFEDQATPSNHLIPVTSLSNGSGYIELSPDTNVEVAITDQLSGEWI